MPKKIILRAPEPSDVDRIYLWENNPEMWPCGAFRAPLSRHQIWEYVNNYDANPLSGGQLRLIIEAGADEEGEGYTPCGIVDLYDIDPRDSRAFVGIMVAPDFRRKGIAAEALAQLEKYCRECLALRLLAAEVASDNQRSIPACRPAPGMVSPGSGIHIMRPVPERTDFHVIFPQNSHRRASATTKVDPPINTSGSSTAGRFFLFSRAVCRALVTASSTEAQTVPCNPASAAFAASVSAGNARGTDSPDIPILRYYGRYRILSGDCPKVSSIFRRGRYGRSHRPALPLRHHPGTLRRAGAEDPGLSVWSEDFSSGTILSDNS